jgi:acetyltransferase-like isoleucine patch superfamily enzyme
MGASVLQGLNVGDDAVIGAGAVLTKDALPGQKLVGIPARPMAERQSSK